MATVVRSPAGALVATVVGSLGTACSDVVVDSIVVERSRGAPQVRGASQALSKGAGGCPILPQQGMDCDGKTGARYESQRPPLAPAKLFIGARHVAHMAKLGSDWRNSVTTVVITLLRSNLAIGTSHRP